MKAEYKEGPEASENFERLAKAVFAAKPKHKERQPKKATARKTSGKKRD
jgi:Na+-transporting methylmalonyl-CoA/oxaloacetate decarboxylase gamma subunit